MEIFKPPKLERAKSTEEKLVSVVDEYRLAFRNYETIGRFIIDQAGFEDLLARQKENIISGSEYIGRGNIDIWKLANKAGKLERFSYPIAEKGDFIHATSWQKVVEAAAAKLKILTARKADFGEGIWFVAKSESGKINLSDIRYGRGKSQFREDFPVAVRIPAYIIDYLRKEEESGERGKIVVERAGQVEEEGYISATEGQGIPLLFLEFGLPDGKWHNFLDLLDVPEVRMKMKEQNKEETTFVGKP